MLSISIFFSVLLQDQKEVYATSVAVGGAVYVTGEMVLSLIVTGMVIAGIIEGDATILDGISTEEYRAYYDNLRSEYEDVLQSMIDDGVLEYYETTSAFKILFEYDTLGDGCNALAEAINTARENYVDLDGNPLDYNALLENPSSKYVLQDSASDYLVVSPPAMNDLASMLDGAIDSYVDERAKGVELINGITADFTYPLSEIDWSKYGGWTLDGIQSAYITSTYGKSWLLFEHTDGEGFTLLRGNAFMELDNSGDVTKLVMSTSTGMITGGIFALEQSTSAYRNISP